MTRSEILTIMVGGMATIAGGVMAAYIQMLGQALADVQKIPLAEAQLRFAVVGGKEKDTESGKDGVGG